MNRLYGLIVADIVCFAIFISLALAGRKPEQDENSASGDKERVSTNVTGNGQLKPRTGGRELLLSIDTEPQTLDPISITDTISDGLGCKIYSKLVRLQLNEKKELKPVPDLCESMPAITGDGTIYTFKLRKGVRFHNGRELKASDVVYSLKRLLSPLSKRADLMFPFVKGSKKYYDENKPDELMHDDPNLGIRALDDYTVEIQLDEPFAPFIQHLSTSSCGIVPREAAENKDAPLSRAPVGSGPFKLNPDDWVSNQYLRMRRFDGYFGGKPKLEGVRFLIYKDRTLPLKRFMVANWTPPSSPTGMSPAPSRKWASRTCSNRVRCARTTSASACPTASSKTKRTFRRTARTNCCARR